MRKKELKISIIMPFYNSEVFIKDTVLSIINQSFENWELIAIDDGSIDDSTAIIESLHDPRIIIYHKPNGGYATAVNFGLEKITGDYFMMIGSDDMLLPGLLNEVSAAIQQQNPDMLVFKVIKNYLDENNRKEQDQQTLFNDELFFKGSYKSFYENHKYEATFFAVRDTGKVFKTDLLKDLKYFGKYGFDADGIFSLLFSHRCESFFVLPFDGYLYNLHSNSLCGKKKTIKQKMDRVYNDIIFLKTLNKIPKHDICYLDYHHSKRGLEVIKYLYTNSKKSVLIYYLPISFYYHLLRKFCRKHDYNLFNKKLLIQSYFPIIYLLYSLLKGI